tara:strand:- start:1494 stop:1703 length:210 start_codon:yes stop_codon:yes gene_type:complete
MTQPVETHVQAVNLLLQGVAVAQKRGAYDLNEAAQLAAAASFLTGPTAETEGAPRTTARSDAESAEEDE